MEKIGLSLDDDNFAPTRKSPGTEVNTSSGPSTNQLYLDRNKMLLLQRYIKSLVHASYCNGYVTRKDANGVPQKGACQDMGCCKMKNFIEHAKACKNNGSKKCVNCRQLMALCTYHSKQCTEFKCLVPYCMAIRSKRHQERKRMKFKKVQMMNRRMASMQRGGTSVLNYQSTPTPQRSFPQQKGRQQMLASPKVSPGSKPVQRFMTNNNNALQRNTIAALDNNQKQLLLNKQQQQKQQQQQKIILATEKDVPQELVTALYNNPNIVQYYIKKVLQYIV